MEKYGMEIRSPSMKTLPQGSCGLRNFRSQLRIVGDDNELGEKMTSALTTVVIVKRDRDRLKQSYLATGSSAIIGRSRRMVLVVSTFLHSR